MPKIVLGFSGGLDTSYCLSYFTQDLKYEVHTITINTGGFNEKTLTEIEQHAYTLGASSHTNINAVASYYDSIIQYLIYGNILKNNTYPLSVSAERLSQAIHIAEHAKKLHADFVAHGSTGAGNDQVRFDLIFNILIPTIKILTPIRDLKLSRQTEIDYLKNKGIVMNYDKAAYSVNKGLWGTSIGGKETLNSYGQLPEHAWVTPLTKEEPLDISLHFEKGQLVKVNNNSFNHPADAIVFLDDIAAGYGIGRDIHVGDTIIGIKGRVAFEAAAPIIIIKAHHLLEKHVLTKWQLNLKDQLAQFYGNWLHEGQILDPVMRNIESFFINSQQNVSGSVFVTLKKNHFTLNGIKSPFDLMNAKFGSYGEMNNSWTGEDVKGFTKIFGNQVSILNQIITDTHADN
ncbi:MAG: argininosuccinate synthase [Alphaproteobacteria bacterium]|nr:argininosuccinate synthase [Alphaproteobacteria bacterium]